MKGLLKILIAVFAVCLIAPAFSAVENVKVGGDIGIYGVLRGDFQIKDNNKVVNEDLHFFQTSARVYVSADLSENVSTMIRLINERNWGDEENTSRGIDLDLAYIKVSDLLTPGLNLTVGRQEIELGEGLVVGSQYNAYDNPVAYPAGLKAKDLGLQKAFDAVKIDYAASAIPLNLTAFLSKINEAYTDDSGEKTLYGLNVGYKVGEVANIDAYYVRRDTDNPKTENNKPIKDDKLDTAGIRVVAGIPAITGLSLKAEYAKQFGEDKSDNDYEGSALLLGASYQFAANMEPQIKVNYVLLSGKKTTDTKNKDWQMVFPSNIGSRIGPLLYAYDAYNSGLTGNDQVKIIGSESNLSVINLGFSIKPVEKVKVCLDGYLQKLDEGTPDDIAKEIDLSIEYKHTEDLTIGLTLGKLLVDDVIEKSAGGKDAWQAIASMKISF